MEKSRAIELLEHLAWDKDNEGNCYGDALNIAIDALKADGTTSDTISRQQAINRFNVIRPADPKKDEYTKGIDVGIAMCIVAVKDQPTIQPQSTAGQLNDSAQSTNLIDRQAAIDALDKRFDSIPMEQTAEILKLRKDLRELPTIQPERAEGHWIWVAGELMCSECHTIYADLYPDYDNAVACPHCGTKMKGETK